VHNNKSISRSQPSTENDQRPSGITDRTVAAAPAFVRLLVVKESELQTQAIAGEKVLDCLKAKKWWRLCTTAINESKLNSLSMA